MTISPNATALGARGPSAGQAGSANTHSRYKDLVSLVPAAVKLRLKKLIGPLGAARPIRVLRMIIAYPYRLRFGEEDDGYYNYPY
jgi:hypothetical protein